MTISRIMPFCVFILLLLSSDDLSAAADFFRAIGQGITSGATTVGEGIKKGATTAYEGVREAGRTVQRTGERVINKGEQVVDAVKSVVNGIRDSISQIRETIKVAATLKGDVIDQFAQLPDQAVQVTKSPIDRMANMANSLNQKYKAAVDLVNKKDLTGLKQMVAVTQDTLTTVLDSTDTLMNSVIDQVTWHKPLAGFARIIISLSQTVKVLVKLVESITVKLIGNVLEQHGTSREVNSVLQEILSVLSDVQLISEDILNLSTGQRPSGAEQKETQLPLPQTSEAKEVASYFAAQADSIGGYAQAVAKLVADILPPNSSDIRVKLIEHICATVRDKIRDNKLGIPKDRATITERDREQVKQDVREEFAKQPQTHAGYGQASAAVIRDIMRHNETWRNRLFLHALCNQLKNKFK